MKPSPAAREDRRWRAPVLLAFGASGAAGVMHEVLWSRQLAQLVGAEAYAQALALALFMGGLALGAALVRRHADGPRPLALYLRLELGIAAYAVCLPLLVRAAGAGYLALIHPLFEHDLARLLLRFALTALVVLPPATLMGATLPLLAAYLARGGGELRRPVASLYAVNGLGAVVGTGFVGLVALPAWGIWGALAVAVLGNLVAAAAVWPLHRDDTPASHAEVSVAVSSETSRGSAVRLAALFASGLCAMGYEVLCVRVVSLALGSSSYAFTVMLMSFLTGLTLGSFLAGRRRLPAPQTTLGITQLGVVVAFVAVTPLCARLPYFAALLRLRLQGQAAGFELYVLGSALLVLAVLLIPTACLGFALPLVAELHHRGSSRVGARASTVYVCSTLGNVAGVLVGSLVLLPTLGLERGFELLWGLNLLAGAALLVARPIRWWRFGLPVAAAALWLTHLERGQGWTDTLTMVPDHFLLRARPAPGRPELDHTSSFARWREHYLVTMQTGRFGSVQLVEDAHNNVLAFGPDRLVGGTKILAVNNKTDASTVEDLETQLLLGHAPLLLVPQARTALVIGHGVGVTTGAVLRHQPDRVDLVEISPAVLKVDPLFANDNDDVLIDPRVRIYVDDGQSFLRAVPRRYDVVISEPSNPWIAGIGDLFTVDFFSLVRAKLAPGGVFTLWFHTYAQSDDTTRLLLRTLTRVFPHVQLFADIELGNVIAVASVAALPIDFAALERRFADPAVSRDLQRLDDPTPLSLLALHRLTIAGDAAAIVGEGPVNTLAHERLRYAGPRALFAGVDSYLLEQVDPSLSTKGAPPRPTLVDRYAQYRAAKGDPVRSAEYEIAADWLERRGGYGPALAAGLRSRIR